MRPRENARRRPPPGIAASTAGPRPDQRRKVEPIVTDPRVSTESRWAARQLHRRGVDLARYYGPRRLLSIGLAELLELERAGRWAA
jgi:hypothetical protein